MNVSVATHNKCTEAIQVNVERILERDFSDVMLKAATWMAAGALILTTNGSLIKCIVKMYSQEGILKPIYILIMSQYSQELRKQFNDIIGTFCLNQYRCNKTKFFSIFQNSRLKTM